MHCWMYDLVAEHRKRLEPKDEGALWLTFLGSDGVITSAAIEGVFDHLDERLLSGPVTVIDGAGAEAVVLVVPRLDARPRAADHRIWCEVALRVDPRTDVLDLVVVGPRASWSLRDAMLERQDS